MRDPKGWRTTARATQYADSHLEVATEQVQTPAGTGPQSWTVVYRKAAVVVAAMTRDGKFVLVQQERIPIRSSLWEMPAGQVDDGPAPDRAQIEAAALRELAEESGYALAADGEMIPLGDYFSSPGFTDEHIYFFLARPVEQCSERAEVLAESILGRCTVTADELRRLIATNEIRDANTLSICARLAARGLLALRD